LLISSRLTINTSGNLSGSSETPYKSTEKIQKLAFLENIDSLENICVFLTFPSTEMQTFVSLD